MKEIIYCRECDYRYEMLDGEMECAFHVYMTVTPDDFCAWGEHGEGTKERQRTKEEEEEFQRWLESSPKVMASSATILTEEDIERMKQTLANSPTTIIPNDTTKTGRWIAHDSSIKDVPTEACSECGTWSYGWNMPFCPNCGARMEEVAE